MLFGCYWVEMEIEDIIFLKEFAVTKNIVCYDRLQIITRANNV